MTRSIPLSGRLSGVAVLVAVASSVPGATLAQDADFLFKTPDATFTFKGGYAVPTADGDVFDFVQNHLTLERSDFRALFFSGEVAMRVNERVDVALELGFAQSTTPSEFRDFVDLDDRPIEQETRLRRMPLVMSVKGYLNERGRTVSRFAWIPGSWSPYVGAGAGVVFYDFEQTGDFVDFMTEDQDGTFEIFTATLRSEGTATAFQVLTGSDFTLSPRVVLNGEFRYTWAGAPPGDDFEAFEEDIDLGGLHATVGIKLRM